MPMSIKSKFWTTNKTVTTVSANNNSMNVGYKNNLRNTDTFLCFSIIYNQIIYTIYTCKTRICKKKNYQVHQVFLDKLTIYQLVHVLAFHFAMSITPFRYELYFVSFLLTWVLVTCMLNHL
jgi:hypothetical protein